MVCWRLYYRQAFGLSEQHQPTHLATQQHDNKTSHQQGGSLFPRGIIWCEFGVGFYPTDFQAPVDVMFYYRAVEWLGELADAAQKVGSRLEVLLAK
jgi:hypothetical protein